VPMRLSQATECKERAGRSGGEVGGSMPSWIAAVGADARPLLALRVELCCLGSSPRALGASVACGLSAGVLASRASPTSVLPCLASSASSRRAG
jgi:hypothetical protein